MIIFYIVIAGVLLYHADTSDINYALSIQFYRAPFTINIIFTEVDKTDRMKERQREGGGQNALTPYITDNKHDR